MDNFGGSAMTIDIKASRPWPSGALSNFAAHPFVFRGVECASMEGFLQSLKYRDPHEQRKVCALSGHPAKLRGSLTRAWQASQTLWWDGQPFSRHGQAYQDLLDEAYQALFSQNPAARDALLATGDRTLTHSIGEKRACLTVLTEDEFCTRLVNIRRQLKR